jgi:hypothetical protein
MRRALLVTVLVLAGAAPASAGEYDPGTVPPESTSRPEPSGRVLHVGRGGIQSAADRARPGDVIRIRPGIHRGAVELRGASKRGVRLVADRATLRGTLTLRDTAAVVVRGLRVSHGAIVVRAVDRWSLDDVRVTRARGAGIDVRRSPGGTITRVRSSANAGAGIALAATPEQVRATRTFVRDVTVEGNAVGIALDRVRAVTVSRARLLANRTGVSARAVREGVLTDSDIRSSAVGVALSAGTDLRLAGVRWFANVTDVLDPQEA